MKPEDKAIIQKAIGLTQGVILPALRRLLEQSEPVQEPKFWYDEEMGELYSPGGYRPDNCTPLYTHPPAQPAVPWSNALESVWGEPAKLREKNGGAA